MIFYIINLILALAGIYVSVKIYQEKKKQKETGQQMTCPLDGECSTVLESKYSKFAGIGLEYFGILYYGTLVVGYFCLTFLKTPIQISTLLFLITFTGFIFSIYLTSVQKYILKMWCTWCLISATTSILMFIVSSTSIFWFKEFNPVFTDLALYISQFIGFGLLILIIKSIATIIGFSSALITDFLTLRFLRDFKIDAKEDDVLLILSHINWISVFILLMTFTASSLIKIDFINPSVFNTSLIILLIIVVNEIVFRGLILPKLISSKLYTNTINIPRIVYLRKIATSLNIISVVSWIYILLIISFGAINTPFITTAVLGDYILINVILIIVINLFIHFKEKRSTTRV
jgi:uncharacterized membrane protein